jgi:hypothetical protein
MYDINDDDIYASVNTSAPSSIERQLPLLELLKVCPCTDFEKCQLLTYYICSMLDYLLYLEVH